MEFTRNKIRVFNFLQGAGKAIGCFYIHPDIDTIMKAQGEGETSLQIKILEDIWNPIDGVDYHKGEVHEINPQNLEQHRREGPLSRLYSPLAMECWSYLIVEQFIYSLYRLIGEFDEKPYEEDQGFKRWVHPWENYELFENRLGRLWQSQGYLRDHCGVNVLNTWNGVRERHSFFLESGFIYNLAVAFVKNFYSLKSSDDYIFLGNRLVRNLNHFAAYSTMLNPNCTMDDFRSLKQIFM